MIAAGYPRGGPGRYCIPGLHFTIRRERRCAAVHLVSEIGALPPGLDLVAAGQLTRNSRDRRGYFAFTVTAAELVESNAHRNPARQSEDRRLANRRRSGANHPPGCARRAERVLLLRRHRRQCSAQLDGHGRHAATWPHARCKRTGALQSGTTMAASWRTPSRYGDRHRQQHADPGNELGGLCDYRQRTPPPTIYDTTPPTAIVGSPYSYPILRQATDSLRRLDPAERAYGRPGRQP